MTTPLPTPDTGAISVQMVDIATRVGQFVKIRDLEKEIKERHEAELAPLKQVKSELEEILRQALLSQNVESFKTSAGTAYLSTKESASAEDVGVFWAYCVSQGVFDMLDKKPNLSAVREFIETHGVPPPGVKFNSIVTVGVRRK